MPILHRLRHTRVSNGSCYAPAQTTALYTPAGTPIVSDLQLVRWSQHGFQLLLCHCGHEGCNRGNWVTARRYGAAIAWIPVFDMYRGDDDYPYAPPTTGPLDVSYLFVDEAALTVERDLLAHPGRWELPEISNKEAMLLISLTAPGECLGRHRGELCRLQDLVLAAHPFDVPETLDALRSLFNAAPTPIQPPPIDSTPATLYLDLPGTPAWSPLARTPAGQWLLLPFGPMP